MLPPNIISGRIMNPTAIYSKSGKGVQEASGKTSLLKRAERTVLAAIDGRASLGEVAEKVGKPFDKAFQQAIAQLDRDGFIREVSPGSASAGPPRGPGRPRPRPPTWISPASCRSRAGESREGAGGCRAARQGTGSRALQGPPGCRSARRSPSASACAPKPSEGAGGDRGEDPGGAREEGESRRGVQRADAGRGQGARRGRSQGQARRRARRRPAEEEAEAEAERARQGRSRAGPQGGRGARKRGRRAARPRSAERERRAERARKRSARRRKKPSARRRKPSASGEEAERGREKRERLRSKPSAGAAEPRRPSSAARGRGKAQAGGAARADASSERGAPRQEQGESGRGRAQGAEPRKPKARAARRKRPRSEAPRAKTRARARGAERAKEPEGASRRRTAAAPSADDKFANSLLAELDSFSQRQEEEEARKTREEEEAGRRRLAEEQERLAQEEAARLARDEEDRRREEAERKRGGEGAPAARRRRSPARGARKKKSAWRGRSSAASWRRSSARRRRRKRKSRAAQASRERRRQLCAIASEARQGVAALLDRPGEPRAAQEGLGQAGRADAVPASRGCGRRAFTCSRCRRRNTSGWPGRRWAGRSRSLRGPLLAVQLAAHPFRRRDHRRRGQIAAVNALPELGSLLGERKTFRRIELEGLALPQEALGEAVFAGRAAPAFSVRSLVLTRPQAARRRAAAAARAATCCSTRKGRSCRPSCAGPTTCWRGCPRKGSELTFDVSAGPLYAALRARPHARPVRHEGHRRPRAA